MLKTIFKKVDSDKELIYSELKYLLNLSSESNITDLFSKALAIKHSVTGSEVYLRGLIELSNICIRDCFYCGIRKSNSKFKRFTLSKENIYECAEFAYKNNFASLVIQAGERQDKEFIDFIEDILFHIRNKTDNKIRVTLSLGEQTEETYKRWYEAGAHRYLLRIETTNQLLFNNIHPKQNSYTARINCLYTLKKLGYQLGTGVLIGFPGQAIGDLVKDIQFFKDIDVDMIGMGPYIPHKDTPIGASLSKGFSDKQIEERTILGLKMIAVTKIHLKDINIASTTALQTLDPDFGLERGLLAGANVIMPNITDVKYKKSYQLYDNKPCLEGSLNSMLNTLNNRIEKIGEKIAFNKQGDSVHYKKRHTEN
jgi:biotin synthase